MKPVPESESDLPGGHWMSLALSQTLIGFWRVEHAETEQRLPRSLTDSIHSPSDSMDSCCNGPLAAEVLTNEKPGKPYN